MSGLQATQTDTLTMADPDVVLPSPVISRKRFEGAGVQAAMSRLRVTVVKLARARVAAFRSHRNKVKALRKVAAASTRASGDDLGATASAVPDGALIRAPKVSAAGSWAIRLTVPDTTVQVSTNLP